jgi:2-methylisocitrate lyase-like PEP mutase family enzyme
VITQEIIVVTNQQTKAQTFRALHVAGRPLVLSNVWDPGSARAVEAAGAPAIATGSWSVAAVHGFKDGEQLPWTLALDNLRRIVANTQLPVSVDLESGYGDNPANVARTFADALAAGAIGCNLEDSFPASGALRGIEDQAQRLRAARAAADKAGVHAFINARIDVFFQAPKDRHGSAMVEAALERARAFAAAGADGAFVPGVIDLGLIEALAEASPLPLNIMMQEGSPAIAALAQAGVARVSYGPGPYVAAMQALTASARVALAAVDTVTASGA